MPLSDANVSFISLFVPDLTRAVGRYRALLGQDPVDDTGLAPAPHPFAKEGPRVFRTGNVMLVLYECDGKITHPGDVGLGLELDVDEGCRRILAQGGKVFFGPQIVGSSGRRLAIGMLPDRHFFEIVG